MLILTRRIGESVIIGDEVTVTITGVKGPQVRIGITAPKNITVHRQEVHERIQREQNRPHAHPLPATGEGRDPEQEG